MHTPSGLRDRAILLLGFGGAFRRSEIARIMVSDVETLDEGLRITVRRSKTDQDARGQIVHVPRGNGLCPVLAVQNWIELIDAGPLFRRINKGGRILDAGLTPHAIGNLVKDYAARAGFDPSGFGARSLRSGFLTAAARNGASVWSMMEVSRHKSVESVRGYTWQTAGATTSPQIFLTNLIFRGSLGLVASPARYEVGT